MKIVYDTHTYTIDPHLVFKTDATIPFQKETGDVCGVNLEIIWEAQTPPYFTPSSLLP